MARKGFSLAMEVPIWMMVLVIAAAAIIGFIYMNYSKIGARMDSMFPESGSQGIRPDVIDLGDTPTAAQLANLADLCWVRYHENLPDKQETLCYIANGGNFGGIDYGSINDKATDAHGYISMTPVTFLDNTNAVFISYDIADDRVYIRA